MEVFSGPTTAYNTINKNDFIVFAGDMNARVGNVPDPDVLGNIINGRKLTEFVTFNTRGML